MRIVKGFERCGPRVAALGTFDGVHLGHRELILQGKRLAEEIGTVLQVCTFDRHPLEILQPERAPALLQTADEQAEQIAACGAEEMRVIPFTRETADLEPEAFLQKLAESCELKAVAAGWNYSFGRRGRGNPELLRAKAEEYGYRTLIVPPVKTETGEVISSTAIREKLEKGDLAGANGMLGYAYPITGRVVNGKHQGSRIGFPTANIETDGRKLLPAYGVYACTLESGGKRWNAVVNIGLQPTLPSGKITVEAHALDAEIDLYGQIVRVRLMRFIRHEQKFDGVDQLTARIREDQREAKEYFAKTDSKLVR